ncbi:hypothetical protein CH252_18990 [Rhodococcus sp. 06-1477-1B]|nr:hypothetical protein CH252_18990 [Rhodococcus sp. 06-1477-1B]
MTAPAARLLRDHILAQRLTYNTEADLQLALDGVLTREKDLGHPIVQFDREHRLDGHNRIDFLVTLRNGLNRPHAHIGIEVKINGPLAAVQRQLERYAQFPSIDELLLVTNRAHHHGIPYTIYGKPVVLCSLIGAAL